MKGTTPYAPVDVSKSLFMDLAFLLIATLMLLINEPPKRDPRQTPDAIPLSFVRFQEMRGVSVSMPEEDASLPGESIFLAVSDQGSLIELLRSGKSEKYDLDEIGKRVEDMPSPRTVVLVAAANLPYGVFAKAKDALVLLQRRGVIDDIVEVVRKEELGGAN